MLSFPYGQHHFLHTVIPSGGRLCAKCCTISIRSVGGPVKCVCALRAHSTGLRKDDLLLAAGQQLAQQTRQPVPGAGQHASGRVEGELEGLGSGVCDQKSLEVVERTVSTQQSDTGRINLCADWQGHLCLQPWCDASAPPQHTACCQEGTWSACEGRSCSYLCSLKAL